jgi:hypothetical protein
MPSHNPSSDDQVPDAEANKRMDEALRRALGTPAKPHQPPTAKTTKGAPKKEAPKR